MKKALISVLRLTMLVGVLVLLPIINKGPKAQSGGGQCVTFNTDTLDCPSCGCSNSSNTFPNNIVAVDKSTGIQSI
jgi:hypothetical protein